MPTENKRFQIRRGTAAQWTTSNPVLAAGEQGFETDTRKSKVGDGTTAWTSLAYTDGGTGGNSFGTIAVSGQSNVVADQVNDILTLIAGGGITITTNAAGDSITITATGTSVTIVTDPALPGDNTVVPGVQATRTAIANAVAALVASSPAALDTLNELATALGNDANFAATVNAAIALRQTAAQVQTAIGAVRKVFGITIDGNGSVPSTGVKGYWRAPAVGVIKKVTLIADQSGSAVIDVWRDSYANYPPTNADTITASAKPTLASAIKAEDATLTGWTTSFAAGDVFGFNLDSVATCTKLTLQIEYEAT